MAENTIPKKKFIQFAFIGLLAVIILIQRLAAPGTGFTPLSPWEGDVDSILIQIAGEKIELVRDQESWFVGEGERPADEGKITRMADALNALRLDQQVSREGELERYGLVTEEAIIVEAREGDRLLRSIRIGNQADRGTATYVTVAGKSGVFLAGGSLRDLFETTETDLRNRQIFSLSSRDIISVRVSADSSGALYSLQKQEAGGEERWQLPAIAPRETDQEKAEQFIAQLARISAIGFTESKSTEGRKPLWIFRFQDQESEYRLDIYGEEGGNENAFLARSSTSVDPFTISAWKAEQLMREADWFILEADPAAD
jgi:hypothetical protein